MNILSQLNKIKALYKNGTNILDYFKNQSKELDNSTEAILISYDFQAGSYTEYAKEKFEYLKNYTNAIAGVIQNLGNFSSIMEVGVGEATTLANVIIKFDQNPKQVLGFDISWSRIKFAKQNTKKHNITNCTLFTGDLFNIPLLSNSVDIVYTSHSIEPNGGREKEALVELYRITNKYLVLLEPCYELGNNAAKARMERLGYVKNLTTITKELGYQVVEHRLFDYCSNPLNPTGLTIIIKNGNAENVESPLLACPITKAPLEKIRDHYFCKDSLLVYPVIDDIPCLLSNNAIIASHYY